MIDLRPDFLAIVQKISADYLPNCEVRLFGSRHWGTASPSSDIDLVVVGREKLSWKQMANFTVALEQSNLPFFVDVLDWHTIPTTFQQEIERGYTVLQIGQQFSH